MAFFNTQRPVIKNNQVSGWEPFSRLAINQDTGGAIRGPGRVDIYWGEDLEAETSAGVLAQKGSLYYAVTP